MKNDIAIFITESGQVSSNAPLNAITAINITSRALLNTFNQILSQIPQDKKEAAKQELYDMYNTAASSLLKVFAPELELHPDLTEEAILKAENEILTERAAQVKTEEVLIPLSSLDENGKPVKKGN